MSHIDSLIFDTVAPPHQKKFLKAIIYSG